MSNQAIAPNEQSGQSGNEPSSASDALTRGEVTFSPAGSARVACAETNNACAGSLQNRTAAGGESFPEDIEQQWCRYIRWQEKRLADAGEFYPTVFLHADGQGRAGGLISSEAVKSQYGLHAAVEIRLEYLTKQPDPEERDRLSKIDKLKAKLSKLEGVPA